MPFAPDLPGKSAEYHEYFAPVFRVLVDGNDLRNRVQLDVQSVSVERALGVPTHFSFSIGNLFDLERRDFRSEMERLRLGATVEIELGYRETGPSRRLVRGLITEMSTGFQPSGVPQVTVAGFDRMITMTKVTRSKPWQKSRDSEVIADVVRAHGFEPQVAKTQERQESVVQSQQSDYQLVQTLAERNDLEFYVVDEDFVCRRGEEQADEALRLAWGAGLLSFTPEVNLADQVGEVEVRGWSAVKKDWITGTAKRGEESGREPGEMSGAELVELLKRGSKLSVRRPVRSVEEATTQAQGLFQQRARQFVRGSGECIGMPELAIDRRIHIDGIGKVYSRAYYVEQVTHALSASGYRTTFKVRDPAL